MKEEKKRFELGTAWREAKALIWAHRGRLALGLVLILINRLAGLVLPAASKPMIDQVIGQGDRELLVQLAVACGAATLVQAATSFALTLLLSVAAQRAIVEMRKRVARHVLRLPVSFFDETKSGVLISRIMTDAEGIRNLVGTGVVQVIGGLITASLSLAYLFYLNWRMTSISLVVLLGFGGVMVFAFSYLRPIFRRRGELNAEVTGRLAESMGGVRVVKAYTAERREDLIFARGVHELFRSVVKTLMGTASVGAISSVLLGTIGILMMVMGGRATLAGTMTLGDLISYIFFTGMLVTPMIQISAVATQFSEAFAGLDRIREILREAREAEGDSGRKRLGEVAGEIAFEDVTFSYKEGVPVLKNISFTAPAGTTTALVGSSGSGKSTLTGLVAAFHRPDSGRVLVDDRDLRELRLGDYRKLLGIVLQDNFLFDGTIEENIRYGKPGAGREEVEVVGRIAHCQAFVDDFEDGYDTVVGERGVKLSGGQRQRIAIARAILADPRILILDEATSSLDSESEAMIQDGLAALRRGRTTFVIAHRLSTIVGADQILVLEEGEIVERGTHEGLLARGGRYRELYDKQYKLELDRFINPGEDFSPPPVTKEELLPEKPVSTARPKL